MGLFRGPRPDADGPEPRTRGERVSSLPPGPRRARETRDMAQIDLEPTPEEYRTFATTETGMAEWVKDRAPHPLIFDVRRKQWYFFKRHWWERDEGQKT